MMAKLPTLTERLNALRDCADAYGADIARWPAARREAFFDLLDTDEAALILDEARGLDGFLNAATAPRMSEDLTNRIMAGYAAPKQQAGLFDFLRGLAPVVRLAPAGVLAGLGALGIASGLMSASAQDPLTPEYEALAYVDDLSPVAIDEDGGLEWDAE